MENVISIAEVRAAKQAESIMHEFCATVERLIWQDTLISLSCEPHRSAKQLAACMWENFSYVGDRQVAEQLKLMEAEGLVVRKNGHWRLPDRVQRTVDDYFNDARNWRCATGTNSST